MPDPASSPAPNASPRPTAPKLTKAQRAKVRELVVDEGYSRAEAVAWVLKFEADPGEAADRAWDMAKDEGEYDAHPEAR